MDPNQTREANQRPPRRKSRKIHWPRMVLFITAVLLVSALGIGSGLIFAWATEAPTFNPNELDVHTTTIFYDINGSEFAKLHGGENRTLVEMKVIPQDLKNAFLAIEDNKFYDHHGVDFFAMVRAVIANVTGGFGSQGASTITQQLVKNAFLTPEKTIKRKVQEVILAFQLERTYSKEEILLMYLNRIFFGEGAYGVQAAAQTFFGKDVKDIKLHEAALLAGLPNAPSKWSPYRNPELAEQRRQLVLSQMAKFGYVSPEEAEKAKQTTPKLTDRAKRSGVSGDNLYPYFIDHVIEECIEKYGINENLLFKGGLKIYTTVDPKVQKAAEAALADPNNYPKGKDNVPVQAAMAVVDHSSGQVKALVGGREYTTRRGLNRATRLIRQPGSVFKPVAVYGPALEKGLTPATVLDDVPVKYGSYEPDNYDGAYRGLISMREATRLSVNIYAVKMLNEIGVQNGFNFARKLGISTLDEKQDKVLGLALGGLSKGSNPLDLSGAYGAFANKGVWIEPHVVLEVYDRDGNPYVKVKPKQQVVMKETTAYLMTNMLETAVQSGTGTNAKMDRPVAGKTGTTELPQDVPQFKGVKGNKDAWFAGYTPELVGVVWMGYDETDKNHYLYKTYGGSYPAQIWRSVMAKALQGVKAKDFPRPSGIVEANIDIKSGLLPSPLTPESYIRTEIFDEKTVPKETSQVWAEVDICVDTGQPYKPGDKCAKTIKSIFLKRPVPYTGDKVPEDAELETPIPKTGATPVETKPLPGTGDGKTRDPLGGPGNMNGKNDGTGRNGKTPATGTNPGTPGATSPGTTPTPTGPVSGTGSSGTTSGSGTSGSGSGTKPENTNPNPGVPSTPSGVEGPKG